MSSINETQDLDAITTQEFDKVNIAGSVSLNSITDQEVSVYDQNYDSEDDNYRSTEIRPGYVVYRVKKKQVLNKIFSTVQAIPPERKIKPGIVTTLMFAKQLRDKQFERAYAELNSKGETLLYAGTVAAKPKSWIPWIREVNTIEDSWADRDDQKFLDGERTPTEIREFRVDQTFQEGIISPPSYETPQKFRQPMLLDNVVVKDVTDDTLNFKTDDLNIDTDPFLDEEAKNDDDRTEVLSCASARMNIHSRASNEALSQIHSQLGIPIVFTDLYLNIINELCRESDRLSKNAKSIKGLSTQYDDPHKRAFRLLNLYARSVQPPFIYDVDDTNFPVVHLELFFSALIRSDKMIKGPKIPIKHYKDRSFLTETRYQYIIESLKLERNRMYKAQGIGERIQAPGTNRFQITSEADSFSIDLTRTTSFTQQ